MAQPFAPIEATREAIGTVEFDVSSESEMRRWFLHQIRLHRGIGNGFMIYAGLEDGTFSGYGVSGQCPAGATSGWCPPSTNYWYTERKGLANSVAETGSNPQLYNWSGRNLSTNAPFETSTCATGKICSADAPASRSTPPKGCLASSSCRAHNSSNTVCSVLAQCKTEKLAGGSWSVQAGKYLSRDCSATGVAGTEATSTGNAAALAQAEADCGGASCVGLVSESCVDKNVRVYYGTAADGTPIISPTRWRLYDPRVRTWYTGAKALWEGNKSEPFLRESWSAIYGFASGQGMGLTAVRTVVDPSNASSLLGVLAVDYSLTTIKNMIRQKFGE